MYRVSQTKLNNQCESLTSLLEEERQAHSNTVSKLEELDQQLDVETRDKVYVQGVPNETLA